MVLTQNHRHSLEDSDKKLPGTPPPAYALFLYPVIFHQLLHMHLLHISSLTLITLPLTTLIFPPPSFLSVKIFFPVSYLQLPCLFNLGGRRSKLPPHLAPFCHLFFLSPHENKKGICRLGNCCPLEPVKHSPLTTGVSLERKQTLVADNSMKLLLLFTQTF